MTTIVLNTATGAVTEYDWPMKHLSPGFAASDAGLFALGGDTDNGVAIAAEVRSGLPGGEETQNVGTVFVAHDTETAAGVLVVQGRDDVWTYSLAAREKGVSVGHPGRGINESYLGFGFRNVAGADFRIDRIDAVVFPSKTRRK